MNDRVAQLERRMTIAEGVATHDATESAHKFDVVFQQMAANYQEWSQKFAASDQHVASKIVQIEAEIMRLIAEAQQGR